MVELCVEYCWHVVTCVGQICAPGYLDQEAFVGSCAHDCEVNPGFRQEAATLAGTTCDELNTLLCDVVPELAQDCACPKAGPVTDVCGAAITDTAWWLPGAAGCPVGQCPSTYLVLWPDLSFQQWITNYPARADASGECSAGEWVFTCSGPKTTGQLWFQDCSGILSVQAFEALPGVLRLGDQYFVDQGPAEPFLGTWKCDSSCAP